MKHDTGIFKFIDISLFGGGESNPPPSLSTLMCQQVLEITTICAKTRLTPSWRLYRLWLLFLKFIDQLEIMSIY